MRKGLVGLLCFLLGFIVCAGIAFAIYFNRTDENAFSKTPAVKATVTASDKMSGSEKSAEDVPLIEEAIDIAGFIKNQDYEGLAQYVHPEYGVVFSPYATIDLSSNKCFTASEVANFGNDQEPYVWGIASGTGDPIEMTPEAYFEDYVYDYDYVSAPLIGINQIVKTGNSLENMLEMFPEAQFIELNNPGDVTSGDGLDWSTLRLVFEEYNGEMMLTAIVHSEYTV